MSVFTFSTPDLEDGRISRMDDKGNGALTYKLPELVESVRQGWIYSAQGAAVVSALLCGAETQLITIVQGIDMTTPKVVENPAALRFLTLLSYSAFVINASATIASLLMIDRLGEIPLRAKRFFDKHVGPLPPLDYRYLLELHAAGGRWTWMKWHCLISLVAGSWCMILQLWLYIFLIEASSVWITMTIVCLVGISPWFALLISD